MALSRSSSALRDPLSDVLRVLGARVSRLTRLEAAGRWALAFPAIDRLKFVSVVRGEQWIVAVGHPPGLLSGGNVCLLRRAAYAVASGLDETPQDGRHLYASGCDTARLGGSETIGIGGTVTFTGATADFLLDRLPGFLVVPKSSPGAGVVAAILELLSAEMDDEKLGGDISRERLADVLLVQAIRAYAGGEDTREWGWLRAMMDPRLQRALRAIHADIAHPWTVARLATVAGMSRAAFAAEFARQVGQAPLAYVRSWRLILARSALDRGDADVATIARRTGYSSQSAFGHAYKRAFGLSPRHRSPCPSLDYTDTPDLICGALDVQPRKKT